MGAQPSAIIRGFLGGQGEPWNCITREEKKRSELEKVRREKYCERGERANPEDSDPFDRHIQRVLALVILSFLRFS